MAKAKKTEYTQYSSPEGYHRHKCDSCAFIWEHCDSMANNDDAHKCPKCGEYQWMKYRQGGKPCQTMACDAITPVGRNDNSNEIFELFIHILTN
jgi:hypothetical protein